MFLSELFQSAIQYATIPYMKKGVLIQNGVHLEDHEWKTVKYFLDKGIKVELLPKSDIKDFHIGDFIMEGLVWEAKAPIGDGKKNVENKVQEASHQSSNIIIDLRRSRMQDDKAAKAYEQEFWKHKGLRRMKIIRKDGNLIDIKK